MKQDLQLGPLRSRLLEMKMCQERKENVLGDEMLTEAKEPHYQSKTSEKGVMVSCKLGPGRGARC